MDTFVFYMDFAIHNNSFNNTLIASGQNTEEQNPRVVRDNEKLLEANCQGFMAFPQISCVATIDFILLCRWTGHSLN
jgi:hypothetical protein